MHERSQNILTGNDGQLYIEGDWFTLPLPANVKLDEHSYPDTAFSFIRFHSKQKDSFVLGFGSGNYGHSNFIGGEDSHIEIGRYVVLQGTTLIATKSIHIKDHTMLSWGSVVSDSWLEKGTSVFDRRKMLIELSSSPDRILVNRMAKPVTIEENVWIGFKAVILPGVTLGRGCVIGSCSVIREDVPPYAVVAGNPSKIIRYLPANDTPDIMQKAIDEYSIK
jgi:acetyltransferase-like isoleucine patch superfamily enzyme